MSHAGSCSCQQRKRPSGQRKILAVLVQTGQVDSGQTDVHFVLFFCFLWPPFFFSLQPCVATVYDLCRTDTLFWINDV